MIHCPACERGDFETYYAVGMHLTQSHRDQPVAYDFGRTLIRTHNHVKDEVDQTTLTSEQTERYRRIAEDDDLVLFVLDEGGLVHALDSGYEALCGVEVTPTDSKPASLAEIDGKRLSGKGCSDCAGVFGMVHPVEFEMCSDEADSSPVADRAAH